MPPLPKKTSKTWISRLKKVELENLLDWLNELETFAIRMQTGLKSSAGIESARQYVFSEFLLLYIQLMRTQTFGPTEALKETEVRIGEVLVRVKKSSGFTVSLQEFRPRLLDLVDETHQAIK